MLDLKSFIKIFPLYTLLDDLAHSCSYSHSLARSWAHGLPAPFDLQNVEVANLFRNMLATGSIQDTCSPAIIRLCLGYFLPLSPMTKWCIFSHCHFTVCILNGVYCQFRLQSHLPLLWPCPLQLFSAFSLPTCLTHLDKLHWRWRCCPTPRSYLSRRVLPLNP